jgi:hypothetical protein
MNAEKAKQIIDTPEVIASLERAALRDLLQQIERGEGEQIETRRRVGEIVSLLTEDISQRQEMLKTLEKRQFILSTMQNYMEKMRAAHEAKQEAAE